MTVVIIYMALNVSALRGRTARFSRVNLSQPLMSEHMEMKILQRHCRITRRNAQKIGSRGIMKAYLFIENRD
jgi:hypothetical protein